MVTISHRERRRYGSSSDESNKHQTNDAATNQLDNLARITTVNSSDVVMNELQRYDSLVRIQGIVRVYAYKYTENRRNTNINVY
jgi:hypothetical protein